MSLSNSRHAARFLVVLGTLGAAIAISSFRVNQVNAAAAQAKPEQLKSVLAEMDAASAKFQSAQADLRQELFTKAVQDTETQAGQVVFLRSGASTQMGMKIYAPDAKPGDAPAEVVEFKGSNLRIYYPGTNQLREFSATGKNQGLAETIMSLGFGASGTDLAKSWTITDQGKDQMSDGGKTVPVEKLDLVSKDPSIRNNYATHITIWIDPARDVSLKQVSYNASNGTPTGDTRTVYYTNIRLNQKVDVGPFAIKCKGKCS
jgi:outer membrane lipoprotein-sorting protein